MTAAAVDRNFQHLAPTQEEEDAYNYLQFREGILPVSPFGSTAHLIKGALGAGILSGHVAYMHGGVLVALILNVIAGIFMGVCLYLLVISMQILLKRTKRPFLSYADTGEAAMMLFPIKKVAKFHSTFRYFIDIIITIDLFGACCCYQLIIAKSCKQLVENTAAAPRLEGLYPGYPSLRHYVLIFLPIIMLVCTIRQLKFLAPFTIAGNIVVLFCIILTINYCFENNPKLQGLALATSFGGAVQYLGIQVFAMSCCGLVIPVESNMKDPTKFGKVLFIGMVFIIAGTMLTSFFGYAAYLDKSTAPITVNFPMRLLPKIFKVTIMVMMVSTHALNFWVPFNLVWYYLKYRHNQARIVMWERIWRVFFVGVIGMIAVIFPAVAVVMGFIGSLCICNMACTFPCVIYLLVFYERPGYGKFKWRLWLACSFIGFAVFLMFCGVYVNGGKLIGVVTGKIIV